MAARVTFGSGRPKCWNSRRIYKLGFSNKVQLSGPKALIVVIFIPLDLAVVDIRLLGLSHWAGILSVGVCQVI